MIVLGGYVEVIRTGAVGQATGHADDGRQRTGWRVQFEIGREVVSGKVIMQEFEYSERALRAVCGEALFDGSRCTFPPEHVDSVDPVERLHGFRVRP